MSENRFNISLIPLLLTCWVVAFSAPAQAQLQMVAHWQEPASQIEIEEQARILLDAGIRTIVLTSSVRNTTASYLYDQGFDVIADPKFNYLHRKNFINISDSKERIADAFFADNIFIGILSTSWSAFYYTPLKQSLSDFRTRIQANRPDATHYILAGTYLEDNVLDGFRQIVFFTDEREPAFYTNATGVYTDFDFSENDLHASEQLLSNLLDNFSDKEIWFNANHFIDAVDTKPQIINLFKEYATQSEPKFPLPAPDSENRSANFGVLILVLLSLAFAAIFRLDPVYNKAFFRYFNNHPFFIVDVFERHLRFGRLLAFLITLFALFSGLAGMEAMRYAFSGPALNGLISDYEIFATNTGLFLFFAFLNLGLNAISIIWISATCIRTDVIPQTAALVLWPQHILILVSMLTVVFVYAGYSPFVVLIALALLIILPYMSFYFASMDFAQNPTLSPGLHHLLTSILFTVVVVLIIVVIYNYSYFFQAVELMLYNWYTLK